MHERQVLFLLWARRSSSWDSLFFSQCGYFAKIGTLQLATGLDPLLEWKCLRRRALRSPGIYSIRAIPFFSRQRVPCQTKLRNGKLKSFLTVSVPCACGKSNCCKGWTDGNAFASLISAAMNSCLTNSRKPCGTSWMRSRGDCPMAIGSPVLKFFGDFTLLLVLDRWSR